MIVSPVIAFALDKNALGILYDPYLFVPEILFDLYSIVPEMLFGLDPIATGILFAFRSILPVACAGRSEVEPL